MLIAGAIVLIIALLLACPVTVSGEYEEELSVTVRDLFFRIRVLPQQEKKKKAAGGQKQEKKKAQAEQTEETKNKIREILKKKGVSSLVELLSEAASLAVSVLKRFFSHVHISLFDLFLLVAAEDAAETAVLYGKVCGSVYTAAGAFMQACDCRRFGVSVVPDFQRSKTEARFRFRAWVSLFYILQEGVSALIRAAKLWQKFQSGPPEKGTKENPSGAKST